VDPEQVAGYADVIKHPMDFGTMERKALANRYHSLEEFTDDFRLVISNATIFNPPDSLYHSEALRISAYGLDQISKASSTVIQYETDWNIDVVEDQVHAPEKRDNDAGAGRGHTGRSPSVQSQQQPSGRGQRNLQNRRNAIPSPLTAKSESSTSQDQIVDGRLPGSLDGVGAFPPGSELANMMVELKIKGESLLYFFLDAL
jgi:bromodomain-containing protein 7/9